MSLPLGSASVRYLIFNFHRHNVIQGLYVYNLRHVLYFFIKGTRCTSVLSKRSITHVAKRTLMLRTLRRSRNSQGLQVMLHSNIKIASSFIVECNTHFFGSPFSPRIGGPDVSM